MSTKAGKGNLLITGDNKSGSIEIDYAKLRKAVLTVRAVNHPMRKKILEMLEEKDKMTVTSIYKKLKVEQSVASQHLALLRKSGMVITLREGKFIYYSANQKRATEVTVLVDELAAE